MLAESRPDIAEASLLIAVEADPAVDAPMALAEVDRLADEAAVRGGTSGDIVAVLREKGFAGDRDDYDDPRNSFLHTVLERRRGLPILLSALTIAVAKRIDVPIAGVGLPGHFIVVDRSWPEPRYLDPFDGWADLTGEQCADIVRSITGVDLVPQHLEPVGVAAMLQRMLLNLRGAYLRRRRLVDALWTVELSAIVDPDNPGVRVEHRALLIGLGRYDEAEHSAKEELAGDPPATIRRRINDQLAAIGELRLRMN